MSVAFDTLKFAQTLRDEAKLRLSAEIRAKGAAVNTDVLPLKSMMGFPLAFQVVIFAKLFIH